jgi:AraC-like DNA-binding protein
MTAMEDVMYLSGLGHDTNPVALRNHRVFESLDLDYTREAISNVLQPHDLRPQAAGLAGACYLDHIPLNRTGIGAIRFGEMQVHVPEIADYHLFIMCLRGQGYVTVERETYCIDRIHGLLVGPGEQMLALFSHDCEQLFVRISTQAVAQHTGFRKLQFKRAVDLRNPMLAPWLLHVATIISDEQTSNLLRSSPNIAKDYERLLLNMLLAGQGHYDEVDRPVGLAPKSVRRAEEFIRAAFADPLTLADIALAADVPTRTLLENFRRFRETSPIRYLRDVRLDNVRGALIAGTVPTAAVAALDSGLLHLGRFAKQYAKRFGERPSDTLKKGRSHG